MRSIALLSVSLLLAAPAPARAQQHRLDLAFHRTHTEVGLTVAGARKGMPILLFVGTKEGHSVIIHGNDTIRPLVVGIARPVTMLVLGVANADGRLVLRFKFSGTLPRVLLQAVSPSIEMHNHRTMVGWLLSRVVATPHG